MVKTKQTRKGDVGAGDLLRVAVSPRWLVALALTLCAVVGCGALASWQWSRTQAILAAERAAAERPVDLDRLLPSDGEWPTSETGRTVRLSGAFTGNEILLDGRELGGDRGVWVVSEFETDGGNHIIVVRGWLPEGEPSRPSNAETVLGVLHPDERFYPGANSPSRIVTIDAGDVGEFWNVRMVPGYVIEQGFFGQTTIRSVTQTQPGVPQFVPPTVVTDVPFPLQNFFYAIQWWVFAAFAVVIYVRWLYLEARNRAGETTNSGFDNPMIDDSTEG